MREQASLHSIRGEGAMAAPDPGDRPAWPATAPDDPTAWAPPRAGAPPPPVPGGWTCLRDCDLGGASGRTWRIPFVLLQPEIGVALIEIEGAAPPVRDAVAALRERLRAARFDCIFPGYLPVVHRRVTAAEIGEIDALLGAAFAAQPPLSVPGGDAWASVLQRALAPRSPGPAATHAPVGHPPPRWNDGPDMGPAPAPGPSVAAPRPIGLAGPGRGDGTVSPASMPEAAMAEPAPPGWDEAEPGPGRGRRLALLAGGGFLAAVAALALAMLGGTASPPPAGDAGLAAGPVARSGAGSGMESAASPASSIPPTGPARSLPRAAGAAPREAPPPPAAEREAFRTPPPAAEREVPRTPPPAPARPVDEVTVRTPANLRAGPGIRERVLRTTRRGERFHALARRRDGWVQVGIERDGDPLGWIHASLLEDGARAP